MIFVKLDRLMSEIIDSLFEKKPVDPAEIRTHDPWIRFQCNNIQRPSDPGYSASIIL
jgi:hypothetical protein